MFFKHPTAEVSEEANIGEGTKIWNNAQVRENVIVGKDCIIAKDVYIDLGVIIGNNVKIQNRVNVYNGVIIEDNVFLGPSMTFTNDKYPRTFNKEWKIYKTIVRKGASIGANCTIVCGIEIGKYAMIGSGSVVVNNVNPYELLVGNPARVIGYVCKCGQKLNNELYCITCGKKYFLKENILSLEEENE